MDYIAIDTNSFRYLEHYGIKGQKWGIRRYQNADGTLTPEGRARAGKEYKEDNKNAYTFGKKATIDAAASKYADARKDRAQRRYDKNPSVRNADRLVEAKSLQKKMKQRSEDSLKVAQEHHRMLVRKYGKENVSDIKYDGSGKISERVHTGKEIALSVVSSLGGTAAINLLTPLRGVYVSYPKSKLQYGRDVYNAEARNYRNRNR